MLVLTLGFLIHPSPRLLSRLTFTSYELTEGYSTTANIVRLGPDYGLAFDQLNQTLMTPIFNVNEGLIIQLTWLGFLMTELPVTSSEVLVIMVGEDSQWVLPSEMRLDVPSVVFFDGSKNVSIALRFVSPWQDQGSRLQPILKSLEVYDGSTASMVY